jgi:hypothetical protein
LQRADDAQGGAAQLLVLAVGERLRGRDDDGVAGVHPHGIEVLHVADGDAGARGVAHHLVLQLAPAVQRALHQHLADGRGGEAAEHDLGVLVLGLAEAAAGAAQGEGGAHHQRQSLALLEGAGLGQRGHRRRHRHRLADVDEQLLEQLAVLGGLDGGERRAQQAHAVPLQHARVVERDGEVQPRLAAERGQQAVGLLGLDDALQHRHGERLDVDRVGGLVVGHDRRRVAVDQDDADALLAQRLAGLGAGVVELGGLADDDGAAADDQDAPRLLGRHRCRGGRGHLSRRRVGRDAQSSRRRSGSRVRGGAGRNVFAAHRGAHRQELVEHRPAVLRSRRALGVVLHREGGQAAVAQPLDAAVVEVALADVPARARGDAGRVDLELVVLRGDEDGAGDVVANRVVAAVVAELEPRGARPDGLAEDLVAQADAQQGDAAFQQLLAQTHGVGQPRGVAGTVGEDHPVGVLLHDLLDARVGAQHHHRGAARAHRAQHVALHPVVEDGDAQVGEAPRRSGQPHRPLQRVVEPLGPFQRGLADGGLADQVEVRHRERPPRRLDLLLGAHRRRLGDHPAQGSMLAQVPGQRPRVDAAQSRHAPARQLVVQGALAARMPDLRRQLAHHHGPRVHPPRLHGRVGAAVVADQRVGHHHHLSGVGGVGGHLLVAAHAGVEDHLTADPVRAQRRAEQRALEDSTRLQREAAVHRFRHAEPPGCRPRPASTD